MGVIFWLAVLIICLVVEAATVGLVSIWFALGSLGALIVSALGAKLWLQVAVFVVISAVVLVFLRPLAKKYLKPRLQRTNADRVLDMPAVVTEDIDNMEGTGKVSVGGKIWTARSYTGEPLFKDTVVRAVAIEGVKLIVRPVMETENRQ